MAKKASEKAYEVLRDEILDWTLAPGTILGEVEQALRLGVSRTPLREALGRLTADGLVTNDLGRGLVVTALSTKNVEELFELRQALEQQAARLAAKHRDPDLFLALKAEFVDMASARMLDESGRQGYYDLVRRFDEAIDQSVSNQYLLGALRNLRIHLSRLRRLAQDNPFRLVESASEHLVIVGAIADGDSELAAHATHIHLYKSLRYALSLAQGEDGHQRDFKSQPA
jgi:DNA-binding GntR family transcriptional regulator